MSWGCWELDPAEFSSHLRPLLFHGRQQTFKSFAGDEDAALELSGASGGSPGGDSGRDDPLSSASRYSATVSESRD